MKPPKNLVGAERISLVFPHGSGMEELVSSFFPSKRIEVHLSGRICRSISMHLWVVMSRTAWWECMELEMIVRSSANALVLWLLDRNVFGFVALSLTLGRW